MMKIKKPLITRIVGNGLKPFPTLIAIVFLFAETGYSAIGSSKLRPPLQFSDTEQAVTAGETEPIEIAGLTYDEVKALDMGGGFDYQYTLRKAIKKGDKGLLEMTKKAYAKIIEKSQSLEIPFRQISEGNITAANMKVAYQEALRVMEAMDSITGELHGSHPLKAFLLDSLRKIIFNLGSSVRMVEDGEPVDEELAHIVQSFAIKYQRLLEIFAFLADEKITAVLESTRYFDINASRRCL